MAAQRRGWLIAIDRDIFDDYAFSKHVPRLARGIYFDSMFAAAATDGPGTMYPHSVLVDEVGADADTVATALIGAGLWEMLALGYVPLSFALCWIKPDGRTPIPAKVRKLVYERDEYRCVHCAATEPLSIDHIYPWSRGGSDDPDNLQTLCRPCNSKKRDHIVV